MMVVKMVDDFDFAVDGFAEIQALLDESEDLLIVEHFPGDLDGEYEEAEDQKKPEGLSVLTLESVVSSNVMAVGHLSDYLAVKFKGGSVYVYFGVPSDTIEELNSDSSVGSYLASHIKPRFACERIS